MERVQITQAALAILDVRLDQISGFTGALVTGIALVQFRGDEFAACSGHDLLAQALLKFGEQILIAKNEARVEQGGADDHVLLRIPDRLRHGTGGVADLETQIPEQIEHELDDALAPRGLLVGQQEQQIDVRVWRQLSAAIASRRHDAHAFRGGRVYGPIQVGHGKIINDPDEFVLEVGKALGTFSAVTVGLELALDRGPVRPERSASRSKEPGSAWPFRAMRLSSRARSSPGATRSRRNRARVSAASGPWFPKRPNSPGIRTAIYHKGPSRTLCRAAP